MGSDDSIGMNSRATHLKFVCPRYRITHVISIPSASQLHFLADDMAELARGSQ